MVWRSLTLSDGFQNYTLTGDKLFRMKYTKCDFQAIKDYLLTKCFPADIIEKGDKANFKRQSKNFKVVDNLLFYMKRNVGNVSQVVYYVIVNVLTIVCSCLQSILSFHRSNCTFIILHLYYLFWYLCWQKIILLIYPLVLLTSKKQIIIFR